MAKSVETVTCPVCSGFCSGTVTQLFVEIGDRTEFGTEVIEVENEMALVSIPSNRAGIIVKIHLRVGGRVDWHTAILDIETD